jgi:hypothetical protein
MTFLCLPMMTKQTHGVNSEPGEGVVPPQVIDKSLSEALLRIMCLLFMVFCVHFANDDTNSQAKPV